MNGNPNDRHLHNILLAAVYFIDTAMACSIMGLVPIESAWTVGLGCGLLILLFMTFIGSQAADQKFFFETLMFIGLAIMAGTMCGVIGLTFFFN